MEYLVDTFGEGWLLIGAGALIGVVFGIAAFHSKFCLRSATVEVAHGEMGTSLAIWLVAFTAALASVQISVAAGLMDVQPARQLSATGSMSGAIIGGLMFGCGMILARGCVSRLLVLSASGNLRAIVTGLVVTLVAQASLSGVLASMRESLAAIWTVPGGDTRSILHWLELSSMATVVGSLVLLGAALLLGHRQKVPLTKLVAAFFVGFAVFGGWFLTTLVATSSFEVIAIQSVTFTGPSIDTLMALVGTRSVPLTFGIGLVLGVFLGAFVGAIWTGQARIQRFEPDVPMERYLLGGSLMGFGSMLAGGCAVGAGLTGGSILALTAWVAVFFMWIGALVTQRTLDALSLRPENAS
ncbi:MAG: YeeE/YedE family protein [Pseudomonadota bacterium]